MTARKFLTRDIATLIFHCIDDSMTWVNFSQVNRVTRRLGKELLRRRILENDNSVLVWTVLPNNKQHGRVRRYSKGHQLSRLMYEAYYIDNNKHGWEIEYKQPYSSCVQAIKNHHNHGRHTGNRVVINDPDSYEGRKIEKTVVVQEGGVFPRNMFYKREYYRKRWWFWQSTSTEYYACPYSHDSIWWPHYQLHKYGLDSWYCGDNKYWIIGGILGLCLFGFRWPIGIGVRVVLESTASVLNTTASKLPTIEK